MIARANPRVSVIIPAFNAARFLAETLDSVMAQTAAPFEIIVIDDGSHDGTDEIALQYGEAVTLLRTNRKGVSGARNAGAAAASGDWLGFLDADDLWLPNKLERQFAALDGRSPLVYCDRINVGNRGGLPEIQSEIQPLLEGDVFTKLLLTGNAITTSGVLMRADLFRELGGFDENPAMLAEDWDLWLRVAASHTICACREPLIRYRLHEGGLSRRLDQMMAARRLVVDRALASPRGQTLDAQTRRRILGETWRVNGWDATRHGAVATAMSAYARSAAYWPFSGDIWMGFARAILRKG
jgi:glycosyltransferase involved in cell wall biosynthesis